MILLVIFNLPSILSQWQLIDYSFTDTTILDQNNWQSAAGLNQLAIGSCRENSLEMIYLNAQLKRISKQIPFKANQLQVILDVYYASSGSQSSSISLKLQTTSIIPIFTNSLSVSTNGIIICNTSNTLLQTVVTTPFSLDYYSPSIIVQFANKVNSDQLMIRNLNIYAQFCNPSCSTCQTTDINYCLTCNDGTQPILGKCQCPSSTFGLTGFGCINECPRSNYTSDYLNQICVQDQRINASESFFSLNSLNVTSNFAYYGTQSPFKKSLCSETLLGYFTAKENIFLQTVNVPAYSIIRLRFTLYMFQWIVNSKIQVFIDTVNIKDIRLGLNATDQKAYYFDSFDKVLILESSLSCWSQNYDLMRVEAQFQSYTPNPIITFQGLMVLNENWAINNITIDIGVCAINCATCSGFQSCAACYSGFYLYNQTCVKQLPIFTSNGMDYSLQIPFSKYLVKAFYDVDMTIEQIAQTFDSAPGNSQTGQDFSFFPNKIVLGGLMVWNNGKYSKKFLNLLPHYAVSVRFNITFGDSFSGTFSWYLDTVQWQNIQRPSTVTDSNIVGNPAKETIIYQYQYYPHAANYLLIEFECLTNQNLANGFCAISEYFIVVHYCQPDCLACTSSTECTSSASESPLITCDQPKYWDYDYSNQSWTCQTCQIIGCLSCASKTYCTQCSYYFNNKFTNQYGNCICDQKFHRVLISNECLCQQGYYDDVFNLNCWPICGDGLIVEGEDCDDGNQIPFDGCHQCKYSCQPECDYCKEGCQQCKIGFTLRLGLCFSNLETIDNIIVSNPDTIAVYVSTLIQNYYPQLCQFSVQGECLNCQIDQFLWDGQCIDTNQTLWYDYQMNETIYQYTFMIAKRCPENCDVCLEGICIKCNQNWIIWDNECLPQCGNSIVQGEEQCDNGLIDQLYKGCLNCECVSGIQAGTTDCNPVCGDNYKTTDEECDDGNSIQYDGCFNCKLECLNCNDCQIGQCLQCKLGYYYDELSICNLTLCGDNVKVGQEQCDDGNKFENDGCFNCECEQGWLYNGSICKSICGDGIVVGSEICDDGNTVQYDGCFQCQLDCNEKCLICNEGQCQQCQNGYNLINNKCINSCGDGLLNVETEECDDHNMIPRDGCYNCKIEQGYLCYEQDLQFQYCERCLDNNCQHCQIINDQQICNQCNIGYFIDEKNNCQICDQICFQCVDQTKHCIEFNKDLYQIKECNQTIGLYYDYKSQDCISQCGDSIISGQEKCDDGNIIDFDGCSSQCQIEQGYLLDTSSNSIISQPNIAVELKQSDNSQFKILADKFYQAINCSSISVKIEQFEETQFKYNSTENESDDCNINLEYFQTIETHNLIHIFIRFKSSFQFRLLNEEKTQEVVVTPQRAVYATDEQKQQGAKVAEIQQALTGSIVVLTPIAVLIGGFKFIWAILDILSWMNNFYYLNVCYPENVKEMFLQANWGNIINIPQIQLLNNPDDPYYFESPQKFNEKEVDPLFFNNVQQVLIFLLYLIGTTLASSGLRRIIEVCYKRKIKQPKKLTIFSLQDQKVESEPNEIQAQLPKKVEKEQFYVPGFLNNICNKCKTAEVYFTSNIIKILQTNYLDLTLAIMLQITNTSTSQFMIIKMNIIFAYASSLISIYMLYLTFKISITHKILLGNKKFEEKYECFYEGIQTESSSAMLYSFTNLLRKMIFIFSTVFFYDQPIFQTCMCFLSCLLNISLIVLHNPFKAKEQLILNFIPDFSIMIIVGISICFAFQDKFVMFSDDNIYQLGWVIVGCIYISIGLQLIFLLKDFIQEAFTRVQALWNQIKVKLNKVK